MIQDLNWQAAVGNLTNERFLSRFSIKIMKKDNFFYSVNFEQGSGLFFKLINLNPAGFSNSHQWKNKIKSLDKFKLSNIHL